MSGKDILSRKVLVFDVDGVIVDSTEECLVTAWNAYQASQGTNHYIHSPEEADSEYCRHFRSLRNYVKTMGEYLVIFHSLIDEITTQEQFDAKLGQIDTAEKRNYADQFFTARNKLKEEDMPHWIKLHRFYPKIRNIITCLTDRHPFYIVTGKDRDSVVSFFEIMNVKIADSQIFDRDVAKNKLTALRHIANLEKVKNDHIYFIDDNITHLIDPSREGFRVFLAGWGYVMKDHFELAGIHNVPVVYQDDLLKLCSYC